MTNEEKFKNRVKDLLEEQYYPYDAPNWDVASKALDEEDGKKRRGLLYFLFSGLGLGLVVVFFLITGVPYIKTVQVKQEKDPVMSNTVLKAEANPERQEQRATLAAAVKSNSKKAEHPVVKTGVAPVKSSVPVSQPFIRSVPLPQSPLFEKTNGSAAPATTTIHEPGNENASNAINTTGEPETTLPPVASVNTTGKNNETFTTPLAIENADQPEPQLLPASVPESKQSKEELKQIASDSLMATNTITKTMEPFVIKDSVAQPIAPLMQDSLLKPAPQPSQPKNAWAYVEAGTFFNQGWKYNNTREGMGFNIYLGLSYLAKLSDKTAFSIGGYYTTLSGLKQDNKEIRSSRVVFGEQTDVVSITPATLNYLVVPVKLHWAINKKQSLTIGYIAGYLLNVQSKVQTYTEILNEQVDKKSYETGGYVEGFKTFTSQLSIGYRRSLYRNLWLNGEFIFGLTDLRDNTFFEINLRERMTGFKVSLTYDLLKK